MKYPEAEKWKATHKEREAIELFFEWCEERGEPAPSSRRLQDLFYEYFEVDAAKLEGERRAMIESQRKRNAQR